MKKTISIMLVIAMLLSMVVAAIPAGAAGSEPQAQATTDPTVPKDVEGLPVTSWDKPWETAADEWTAVATMAELATAIKKGGGIKVYLTADITIDGSIKNNAISNVTVDGNGHAFIYVKDSSGTIFSWGNNIEIRNLILKGELTASSNSTLAPLGGHNGGGACGKVVLKNIWSDVDVTVSSTSGNFASGVIGNIGDNSSLTDVIYTGDFTTTSACKVSWMGGVVGLMSVGGKTGPSAINSEIPFTRVYVTNKKGEDPSAMTIGHTMSDFAAICGNLYNKGGNKFTDVGVNATIVANAKTSNLAGIYGCTSSEVTLENAYVNADISSTVACGNVGGITANSGTATLTNAVFAGSVTTAGASIIGGVVGKGGAINLTNCKTTADAVVSGDAGSIGGIAADVQATTITNCTNAGKISGIDATKSHNYVGGVVGIAWGTLNISNSHNTGTVTTANGGHGDAGVAGVVGLTCGNNSLIKDCTNTAAVTAPNNNAGGILGAVYKSKTTIQNCTNEGSVYSKGQGTGGILGKIRGAEAAEANITGSTNKGAVSGTQSVGGIVGLTLLTLTISSTKNMANLTNSANVANLGGIIGFSNSGKTTLNDVENSGIITAGGKIKNVGGIIGNSTAVKMTDVVNSGAIVATYTHNEDWRTIGGLIGRSNGAATFVRCGNTASISYDNATSQPKDILFGGLIGVANNVNHYIGCYNTGDITVNAAGTGGENGIGGLLGWANNKQIFEGCSNTGNMDIKVSGPKGNIGIGGIAGWASALFTFSYCVNDATIAYEGDGQKIGGILGYGRNDAYSFDYCVNLDSDGTGITATYTGDGNNHVGGILGYKDGDTAALLNATANSAPISATGAKDVKVGGLVGIGAVRIENSVNVGKITGKKANALVGEVYKKCEVFDSIELLGQGLVGGSVTLKDDARPNYAVTYANLNANTKKAIDDIINGMGIFAIYGFEELNEAYETAQAEIADKDNYVTTAWTALENAMTAVAPYYNMSTGDLELEVTDDGNGGYTFDFLSQAEFNKLYTDLVAAYNGLIRKSEAPAYLETLVLEAEEFIANNTATYFDEYWTVFNNAYIAAKELLSQVKIQNVDTDIILSRIVPLEDAMDVLENDLNARGGYIYTAEQFARLDGQQGTFYLMADITITEALESFEGYLNGNGYTITLDGCGIFAELKGETALAAFDDPTAYVKDLTIAGDAGEAKSLFGKAYGDVSVINVKIEVAALADAALFDSGRNSASITLKDIITYADAKYAIVGDVNCAVIGENILAMCEAEALVGETSSLTLANAYLDGVEYYTAGLSPLYKTDAETFASGAVAYHINEAFGEIILVQKLGKDALPYVGPVTADGKNTVILVDGNYVNKGIAIDTDKLPESKPVVPSGPNYADLEAAIAIVETLVKDLYTEESWTALQTVLARAKDALKSTEQDVIDEMLNALTLARVSLDKKYASSETAIDYSALAELIASAKALKEADYTAETWAMLKSMLAMAENAMSATTQNSVNNAKTSLAAAIASLAKAEAEKPIEDKPNDAEDPAPAEDGCGSVIGGAAVAVVAVIALGMGVSFKKKED